MHMRAVAIVAALIFGMPVTSAKAGLYADDLTRCLVKSVTADDQSLFVQWMFSAMSLHPAVGNFANVTADQRDAFNRKAAELMQRLILVDCRSESIAALKYEGSGVLQTSFQFLGQVAGRGLMTEAHVAQGLQGFGSYLDKEKLTELGQAAGLAKQTPPGAPAK